MRDDQHRFLTLLGQVPALLTAEQTAWLLNCQPHDVPVLVAARLLKPLGNPQSNAVKYFAASEILAVCKNSAWLSKLTVTLSQHWQKRTDAAREPSNFPRAELAMRKPNLRKPQHKEYQ